jgi:hypothetical protein
MITGYHTSKHKYLAGDKIALSEQFFRDSASDPAHIAVEAVFEACRPDGKPSRRNVRYVFREEADARFWAEERLARQLFSVSLPENALLHEADWQWLGHANASFGHRNIDGMISAARAYWSGQLTDKPCVEWLVSEATVVAHIPISSEEEKRERKAAKLGMLSHDEFARQLRESAG